MYGRSGAAGATAAAGLLLMFAALLLLVLSACTPVEASSPMLPTHEPVATQLVPAPEPTTVVMYPGVRAGAYCSERGALGTTPTGEAVRCTNSSIDPSYRWRKLQGE